MATVGVYDHGSLGIVKKLKVGENYTVSNARELLYPLTKDIELTESEYVDTISHCDVVICHVGEDAWKALLSRKTTGVIIRMGTDPFGRRQIGTEPREDIAGRYIFHLCVEHSALDSDNWQSILDAVTKKDNCDKCVNGESISGVMRLFSPARLERICALAILCQGYLSTAALVATKPFNSQVSLALTSMGYDASSGASVGVHWNADLAERMASIRRRRWWSDYLVGNSPSSDVWSEFKREWDNAEGWDTLDELLRAIGIVPKHEKCSNEPVNGRDKESTTASEVSEDRVAAVYLKVVKALRGAAQ